MAPEGSKQTSFEDIKAVLQNFVHEREWERFHEPKDLALAISIESGELSEHFLWKGVDEAREHVRKEKNLEQIIDEVADVMIYSLNMVNALERITGQRIDVEKAILEKVVKNAAKYPAAAYKNKARLEKP
ncbi:MAG: nucleotide pyrophosphohydrolase [Candidatus Lokiarchaeota archaeon]|nr:nucleotide pyrophosphohydrolase [Candidatus Lokiarchaeota archaeon]